MMDAVLQSLLLKRQTEGDIDQIFMDFGETDPIRQNEIKATKAYEEAVAREKQFHNIFAQQAIKAHEIEDDLKQADRAIGDPKAVESFVVESCRNLLGVQIEVFKKGYKLYTTNLPPVLKGTLPEEEYIQISFYSPTPSGYQYIGRNHPFVEYLCQFLLACSINRNHQYGPSRASVIRCGEVQEKTTLITFRVRNVIEDKNQSKQLVAEEMLMWGCVGSLEDKHFLTHDEAQFLLQSAQSTSNLTHEASASFLEHELDSLKDLSETFDAFALERSEILVEMHEHFRKAMGGSQYKVVKPVLQMDIIGIYILLPETRE